MSIGGSTWRPDMKENCEEFIRQADIALCSAKNAGRNRVNCRKGHTRKEP